MTKAAVPLLIVLGVLIGLSTHTVVNCGDEDEPDICSAVIGFSPLRGSLIAFAYEGRGRIALRHGDWRRAIADFDEAIHLNPNRASLYRDRAQARRQNGALELAIEVRNTEHLANIMQKVRGMGDILSIQRATSIRKEPRLK